VIAKSKRALASSIPVATRSSGAQAGASVATHTSMTIWARMSASQSTPEPKIVHSSRARPTGPSTQSSRTDPRIRIAAGIGTSTATATAASTHMRTQA
jgi:hypothetical protein